MSEILANLAVRLGAEVGGFKKSMAEARRDLAGFVKAGESMKDIGSSLSLYVSAPLAAIGALSLKSAGEMQALNKGLEAIYKGKGPLDDVKKGIEEIAKLPGLDLKGAYKGSIALQAVGFSAEQAKQTLIAFGNAIATTGGSADDLSEVTRQLGQIQSAGKITAENLNVIKERAPLIGDAIKNAFGSADTTALQKMGVSTTEFITKVTSELGKLPSVAGGLNNSFENASSSITSNSAKIGDAINKAFNVEGLINGFSDGLTKITDAFITLPEPIQKAGLAFGTLATLAGPVLLGLGTLATALPSMKVGFALMGTSISGAASAMKVFLVSSLPVVGTIVATVVAAGALLLAMKGLKDAIANRGNGKSFIENFKTGVGETIDYVKTRFKDLTGIGEDGASAFKPLNDALGGVQESGSRTIPILEKLNVQLQEQQKIRDNATSANVIKEANLEIASIQKQIDYYNNLGIAKAKAGKPLDLPKIDLNYKTSITGFDKALADIKGANDEVGNNKGFEVPLKLSIPDDPEFAKSLASYKEGIANSINLSEAGAQLTANLESIKEQMGSFFTDSIVPALQSVGQALGDMFSGKSTGADFFKSIIKTFADFAQNYGKLMVSFGIAQNALIPGSGLGKIIAGGALIVAAGIAGALGSKPSGSSAGGVPTGGPGYANTNPRANAAAFTRPRDEQATEARVVIEGTQLVAILKKTNFTTSRVG